MKPNNNKNIKPEDTKPEVKPEVKEEKPLQLIIKFTAKTGIHVEAPGNGEFYNIPMCLFLLDSAKDFIKETNFRNSQPKIQQPHKFGFVNKVKGAFGGKR